MKRIGKVLLWCLLPLLAAWSFGAIYYDGPFRGFGGNNLLLACCWLAALVVVIFWKRVRRWRSVGLLILLSGVMLAWLLITPSNDKQWAPEYARTGWVEISGEYFVFHNVRNFSYPGGGEVIESWETRKLPIRSLRGVDYFHNAFMGNFLAHPIMSFDFGEAGHLALTIETRCEKHEGFSFLGGFYKAYELQYIFGDESDLIRLRTNIRQEPVYLYRLQATSEQAREFLLETITAQNYLRHNPMFYNVISANCTTSLRAQRPLEKRKRWDIRILANGLLDELAWERGAIVDAGLPFQQLRESSLINSRAQQAEANFSAEIREGLPGYESD